MTNRRQFLGMALGAAVSPGLIKSGERSRMPLYKAIYDVSYTPAVEFAAEMRRRGVAIHAIEHDVTRVWFNDLQLRWRRGPAAIAGLTAPEALFCLEQLAWDHRMRVVFRATHRRVGAGVIAHEIQGPQTLLRRAGDSLRDGPGWAASMADAAVHCRYDEAPGTQRLNVTTIGGAQGLPLVSWIIAPVQRASSRADNFSS